MFQKQVFCWIYLWLIRKHKTACKFVFVFFLPGVSGICSSFILFGLSIWADFSHFLSCLKKFFITWKVIKSDKYFFPKVIKSLKHTVGSNILLCDYVRFIMLLLSLKWCYNFFCMISKYDIMISVFTKKWIYDECWKKNGY